MFFVLSFVAELIFLFYLSRALTRSLSKFLSVQALSFLFLMGVIVHELSHFFAAAIMFVPVGNMEFVPKLSSGGARLGSVEIGKTDPIRRSIIGFAPVLVGLLIIIGIVYFFTSHILFFNGKDVYIFAAAILGITYLLFAISNTMFSSSKDMEGTLEIAITLLIVFAAAYAFGFRPSFSFPSGFVNQLIDVIQESAIFMLAPISIDLVILGIIKVFYKK
ncbi:MAG: hypothetical protein Q7K29_04155 [Thermoleophilia bacterium]|nr:hypothetical protein [Thermoleophilia bacterium]